MVDSISSLLSVGSALFLVTKLDDRTECHKQDVYERARQFGLEVGGLDLGTYKQYQICCDDTTGVSIMKSVGRMSRHSQ